MAGDILSFALLSFTSMFIIINPLAATLLYVPLTENLDRPVKVNIARKSCKYAILILLIFTLAGGWILTLFGITLEAFRIAGGLLLFGIGMEMLYARTSRTKMTATEKYAKIDSEDVAVVPLAVPMISGPGGITTAIVLMNVALTMSSAAVVITLLAVVVPVLVTYLMMTKADFILKRVGYGEYRAINRLMGLILIAIAVQFVIDGLKQAFPLLSGGML